MKQDLSSITHVLLDIEGTICPISFVKDTLFPYAIKSLPEITNSKWNDPEFEKYKSAFPNECQETTEKFIEHVKHLTERNIKVAYFKDLQGYLWEEGYKFGAYSSPFFDDVAPALRRWKKGGLGISIYSSGSVFAQKLLFEHVNANNPSDPKASIDLRTLVTDWFDTTNAGSKMDSESYKKICKAMEVPLPEVLFLSDNLKELEAAREANLKVALVMREGNDEVSVQDKQKYGALETFKCLLVGSEEKFETKDHETLNTGETEKAEKSVDEDDTRAIEADLGVLPTRKKRKIGEVKRKIERAPPQRRSQRLQKLLDKP